MKNNNLSPLYALIAVFVSLSGCNNFDSNHNNTKSEKILFLHHSTGRIIWEGKDKKSTFISSLFDGKNYIPTFFEDNNKRRNTNYLIEERNFPKANPYGWNNYPFDYYNIWVKNAGNETFMDEPTLEMLTKQYDVIIIKHCYPGSNILEDTGDTKINSERKSLENYKLQYDALKDKMREFPETKYIVWTIPALVKNKTTQEQAVRANRFSKWMKEEWDEPNDNIFIWDFRFLETNGEIYLKSEYARSESDSHPNTSLASNVAPLFCQRIIDIIETNGVNTTLTGEIIKTSNNK